MGRVSEIIAYSNATPEERIDLKEKLTHITITPEIEKILKETTSFKALELPGKITPSQMDEIS